jgi:hypothetical protein
MRASFEDWQSSFKARVLRLKIGNLHSRHACFV